MNRGATRAALAVFAIGVLGVWLVKPIGDACPDVGRLPAGSQSSSSPSFTPPLTRTCTYTTADGTEARQRYVPVVDWLIVAVVAGLVGAGIGLAGPGTPRPKRAAKRKREPRATGTAKPARAPKDAPHSAQTGAPPPSEAERARDRERARQERARRREGT